MVALALQASARTHSRERARVLVVLAVAAVATGAAIRLLLLVKSNWLLEGDDALSALMAIGVLDSGDRPIMLKNQTYAAASEPSDSTSTRVIRRSTSA